MPTSNSPAEQAALLDVLKAEVLPYVRRTRRDTLPESCIPRLELQIAVPLSMVQAECYRMTLARQFEQLGNHKAQRHSGQRASMLRSLCADICRVCCCAHVLITVLHCHPFVCVCISLHVDLSVLSGVGRGCNSESNSTNTYTSILRILVFRCICKICSFRGDVYIVTDV